MTPTPEQIAAALAFFEALPGCTDTQKHGKVLADELKRLVEAIPKTGMEAFYFMESHAGSFGPAEFVAGQGHVPVGPVENVRFSASIHDLLSMFDWVGLGAHELPTLPSGKKMP